MMSLPSKYLRVPWALFWRGSMDLLMAFRGLRMVGSLSSSDSCLMMVLSEGVVYKVLPCCFRVSLTVSRGTDIEAGISIQECSGALV